jgi:hypothetical protein
MIITETTSDRNVGTDYEKGIFDKTKLTSILIPFSNNFIEITFLHISLFFSFCEFVLILVLYEMKTKLNTNKVLFNKLNAYFKDNITISVWTNKLETRSSVEALSFEFKFRVFGFLTIVYFYYN